MMPKFTIIRHFNSHAHVERDTLGKIDTAMIGISTHTLTWSVTPNTAEVRQFKPISTHTLTWSVTLYTVCQVILPINFNSHAHVERDL